MFYFTMLYIHLIIALFSSFFLPLYFFVMYISALHFYFVNWSNIRSSPLYHFFPFSHFPSWSQGGGGTIAQATAATLETLMMTSLVSSRNWIILVVFTALWCIDSLFLFVWWNAIIDYTYTILSCYWFLSPYGWLHLFNPVSSFLSFISSHLIISILYQIRILLSLFLNTFDLYCMLNPSFFMFLFFLPFNFFFSVLNIFLSICRILN